MEAATQPRAMEARGMIEQPRANTCYWGEPSIGACGEGASRSGAHAPEQPAVRVRDVFLFGHLLDAPFGFGDGAGLRAPPPLIFRAGCATSTSPLSKL